MASDITNFLNQLEAFRKKVNAIKSSQIRSIQLREEIRTLIETYFKKIRPTVTNDISNNDDISDVDENMQELLVLSHKAGTKTGYTKRIADIRKRLIALESKIIRHVPIVTASSNSADTQIIDTLHRILPSAALAYRQALIDLNDEQRFSWRGPATDLRESLREILDHLAPDKEVEAAPGYKQEKDTNGPTMKQKVRFILTKRGISKAQSSTSENAADLVENMVGSFVRSVYTRSSISTHTPTDKNEALRIKNFVRATLCELLEINV